MASLLVNAGLSWRDLLTSPRPVRDAALVYTAWGLLLLGLCYLALAFRTYVD
jgi:hypothetical protein